MHGSLGSGYGEAVQWRLNSNKKSQLELQGAGANW